MGHERLLGKASNSAIRSNGRQQFEGSFVEGTICGALPMLGHVVLSEPLP